MRPIINYSKDLRRKLADGRTLDEALTELRTGGASIFDCILSVRTFRRCELAEAKMVVHQSKAWADMREQQDRFHAELEQAAQESTDETI